MDMSRPCTCIRGLVQAGRGSRWMDASVRMPVGRSLAGTRVVKWRSDQDAGNWPDSRAMGHADTGSEALRPAQCSPRISGRSAAAQYDRHTNPRAPPLLYHSSTIAPPLPTLVRCYNPVILRHVQTTRAAFPPSVHGGSPLSRDRPPFSSSSIPDTDAAFPAMGSAKDPPWFRGIRPRGIWLREESVESCWLLLSGDEGLVRSEVAWLKGVWELDKIRGSSVIFGSLRAVTRT